MDFTEKRDLLTDVNPDALLADGFEDALIGYVQQFSKPAIALYDREKCIRILMRRDKMSREAAEEFFEFNVQGSWMGEHTPGFAVLFKGGPMKVKSWKPDVAWKWHKCAQEGERGGGEDQSLLEEQRGGRPARDHRGRGLSWPTTSTSSSDSTQRTAPQESGWSGR